MIKKLSLMEVPTLGDVGELIDKDSDRVWHKNNIREVAMVIVDNKTNDRMALYNCGPYCYDQQGEAIKNWMEGRN